MINICFLLGGFQENGGIGRVTSILANELNKIKNYNVCTISYYHFDKPMLYKVDKNVKQAYLFETQTSMTTAIIRKHAIKRVASFLLENKIDILIACGALYYPLAILACKESNAKCVCWEHTNPQITADYRFQNLCRKYAVKKSDKLVVLTKEAEKYYLNKFKIKPNKLVQIYNLLNDDVEKSKIYNEKSHKILSVGRLSYPKNFEKLIDIANVVLKKYPDWSWEIFGSGEMYETLLNKINNLELSNQVFLKGQVDDLYQRYKDYSFVVMTSRYEGFPMSLIEAAANRLPLISFDIKTGPNEIINNGVNGFLIDYDDIKTMENKIELLINNLELRRNMSNEAYKNVQKFKKEEIIIKWDKIFCELV